MEMQVKIVNVTQEDMLGLVHTSLCSGLPYFVDYGFSLDYNRDAYQTSRAKLNMPKSEICIEDVQVQMLRDGQTLRFVNEEDSSESVNLTLSLIEQNWNKVPVDVIKEFIDENDDAETADKFMQYILFGEIVYG